MEQIPKILQKIFALCLTNRIKPIIINRFSYGDVAQLARAFGSYPKCHVFESHRRYHQKQSHCGLLFFCEKKYKRVNSWRKKSIRAFFLNFMLINKIGKIVRKAIKEAGRHDARRFTNT